MNELIGTEYERAYTLHRRIVINAQTAQESLFEVCKGLKEMHDNKLYKELGYENMKDYSESELGMTKRSAERYIAIARMVEESATPVSQNIGTTKLYLLSTLTEEQRKEVVDTTDIESASKRELEEKIKQFKVKAEAAEQEAEKARQDAEQAKRQESKALGQLSVVKTDSEFLLKKVRELQEEIKELEARPVEVAVEKDPEAEKKLAKKEEDLKKLKEKLKKAQDELVKEKASAADAVQTALDKQAADHKAETDKLSREKAELERRLAVKPKEIRVTVDEDKITFKIKLSTAYEALMPAAQFAAQSGSEEFKAKLLSLLDAARKVVEK